jgi:hypothetical protein
VRLGIDAYNIMAIACRQADEDRSGEKQVTRCVAFLILVLLYESSRLRREVALGRLYEHLVDLLRLPILPLFVFDGPTRPTMKRRRQVYVGAFHIERDFRDIVDAFGFESWTAPGEAEAELAMLCRIGGVDVVMTGDSDAMCANLFALR